MTQRRQGCECGCPGARLLRIPHPRAHLSNTMCQQQLRLPWPSASPVATGHTLRVPSPGGSQHKLTQLLPEPGHLHGTCQQEQVVLKSPHPAPLDLGQCQPFSKYPLAVPSPTHAHCQGTSGHSPRGLDPHPWAAVQRLAVGASPASSPGGVWHLGVSRGLCVLGTCRVVRARGQYGLPGCGSTVGPCSAGWPRHPRNMEEPGGAQIPHTMSGPVPRAPPLPPASSSFSTSSFRVLG